MSKPPCSKKALVFSRQNRVHQLLRQILVPDRAALLAGAVE
jgi:hypothetical protein